MRLAKPIGPRCSPQVVGIALCRGPLGWSARLCSSMITIFLDRGIRIRFPPPAASDLLRFGGLGHAPFLLVSRASQLRACVSNAPAVASMAASIHHGKVVVAICRLGRGLPALRPRLGMDRPLPQGRPSGSTGDGLSVLGGRGGQARTDPTRLSVWLPLPSAGDAIRFGQVRASSRPCDRLFSHSFIPHFVSLGLPGVIVSSRFATEEVNSLNAKPIVLKALLQQRHLQTHRAFCREYDRVAAVIDPTLRGSWPSKAQFYRWLSGDLVGLPYTDHCRILEGMFPDWKVNQLFHVHDGGMEFVPEPAAPQAQKSTRSAPSTESVDRLKEAGISHLWPRTNSAVLDDLVERVNSAREEITVFGLTRNFYAKDDILPLFEAKASEILVTFYVMDPRCDSRRDRYRIEPVEAAMEDPTRYTREILRPLFDASQRIMPTTPSAGMKIFTFNFPCSFAIEKIDRSCRVMLYGHGKRGTEGPTLVFDEGTPYWTYFADQIQWLERLAANPREPWVSKGLVVRALDEAHLLDNREDLGDR
jgi:hypothetical protein